MRVFGVNRLSDFYLVHEDSRPPLLSWLAEAEKATWTSGHDIRLRYPSASFINERVVFNIKGNKYRLETAITYVSQIVVIMRLGTHAEYSRWTY